VARRADTSVPISLEELKAAMERYTDFCRGSMQQDAHEFFCVLLERLQARHRPPIQTITRRKE
jgi:uncharacterized UBP type Zn finger protein